MNVGRYLMIAALAFMGLAAVGIFFCRMLGLFRPGPGEAEGSVVAACLSLLGVLGFLAGLGLAVYDHGYEKLGLALACVSFLAMWGSIFISRRKSRRQ